LTIKVFVLSATRRSALIKSMGGARKMTLLDLRHENFNAPTPVAVGVAPSALVTLLIISFDSTKVYPPGCKPRNRAEFWNVVRISSDSSQKR